LYFVVYFILYQIKGQMQRAISKET
jgi:hypothetical protein